MIVLDASALVDVVVGGPGAAAVGDVITADGDWWAPEHFTVEVISALRGLWLGRQLSDAEFALAAEQVTQAAISSYRTAPLVDRLVELAGRASAYDAAYVALAERLGCPLVTLDGRLRSLAGVGCRFLPATG